MTSSQLSNYLSAAYSRLSVASLNFVCIDKKAKKTNRTKNIGLEMFNIWACHSEGGVCQTVKKTVEMMDRHTSVHPLIYHPYPQSTGSDKRLQMLDPHYYRSLLQWLILGLFPELQSAHQAFSSSAETLWESLAAHISREILTAALLFLFQCTG